MASCKDCIHLDVCVFRNPEEDEKICKCFKSTAEVVEVKHGKWIYHEYVASHDGAKSGFSCSCCCGFVDEEIFDMDEFNKDFCGACGAKMDGGKVE